MGGDRPNGCEKSPTRHYPNFPPIAPRIDCNPLIGHIENLGIYELLKRRCQIIIAVDAEADFEMAFGSFNTLVGMRVSILGSRLIYRGRRSETSLADAAVTAALVPICADKFQSESGHF
jgi:hypothetical protein